MARSPEDPRADAAINPVFHLSASFNEDAARFGIDAIAVGYYDGGNLIFVARTRNGFVPAARRKLYQRLKPLITKQCPFANLPEPRSYRWGEGMTAEKMAECIWVRPKVVVQIDYTNWTAANHLRHSFFKGIREDKRARDVVKVHGGYI